VTVVQNKIKKFHDPKKNSYFSFAPSGNRTVALISLGFEKKISEAYPGASADTSLYKSAWEALILPLCYMLERKL